MVNPFRKVVAGQPVEFGASAYNSWVDSAKAHRLRDQTTDPNNPLIDGRDIVLVRNSSGGDRDRGEVLVISGPVVTPTENLDEFLNNLTLDGVTPSTCGAGRFVVLLEAIPDGEFGRAVISGLTVAEVDLGTASNAFQFADIQTGSHTLVAADYGGAQILWSETQTGKQWCFIRLSNEALSDPSCAGGSGVCGPGYINVRVLDSVSCVNGDLVVCDKSICMPASNRVSAVDCGGGSAGTGLPDEGDVVTECCPGGMPGTLSLDSVWSGCTCAPSTLTTEIVWDGSRWSGTSAFGTCGTTVTFELYCENGEWRLWLLFGGGCGTGSTFDVTQSGFACDVQVNMAVTAGQVIFSSCCGTTNPTDVTLVSIAIGE